MAHVCPWWVGYFLLNPARRWLQDPLKILSPHIYPGMTVADIGCAMGFFSLDMARLVGPSGKVVCVDVQPKMIEKLRRRASKAELTDRIETRLCGSDSLGADDFAGRIDFVLCFAMVHETPDTSKFLSQASALLKPGGKLLVAEPKGHVSREEFGKTEEAVRAAGLEAVGSPKIFRSQTALFQKPE